MFYMNEHEHEHEHEGVVVVVVQGIDAEMESSMLYVCLCF